MIYLWFESERKQYTIIFTTERETKSTKERDGKRRVWEHEHGESGKYVQYCPFMKFVLYNSYHKVFTSIKVHQKTDDNVKREKPSRIWSCTKYPPNSIFIYKWAHTCLLSKYYFSKKVFFFVEIVGLSSAISTLTFISRVLPVCLCAWKEKV